MRTPSARADRTMITEILSRADEISARVRDATITVITAEETAEDLAREDHRAVRMDRDNSVETETVMVREDLQDREIPRTEDHVRATETDEISAREITVTTAEETAETDLAREDHRAVRDVLAERMKDVTAAVRDASEADRIIRAASVQAVQEEAAAADQMQSLHLS